MSDVTVGSLAGGTSTQGAKEVFNLHDEKSVLTLLRKIHQSPLSPDEKSELRDIIFDVRNKDVVDISPVMHDVFAEHGFIISGFEKDSAKASFAPAAFAKSSPSGIDKFGTTRPVPSFGLILQRKSSDTPHLSISDNKKIQKTTEPKLSKAAEPVALVTNEMQPLEVTTQVPKQEQTNKTMVPPKPVATSISKPTVPPEQIPVQNRQSATPTGVTPSERIKEIKKEINALVGNPVNLIDVHNEIGREYMNALLGAMKKNNGGSSVELQEAMIRLESAYTQVKKVIDTKSVPPIVEETTTPQAEEKSVSQDVATEKPKTIFAPEVVTPQKQRASVPADDSQQENSVSRFNSVHQTHLASAEDAPSEPSVDVSVPTSDTQSVSIPPSALETPAPEISPVVTEETQTSGTMMSVAKQKQIKDLMLAKKQEESTTTQQRKAAEIASMDPLMTPEVTSGLQQLLSEWSLFKSSGLFGTGPSGIDHPLYIQLSKLNMTAIVAGRFEGATPQIKRSITDYMNGWRYEEGILQEQGELFEHYLRRVIKHILSKRK